MGSVQKAQLRCHNWVIIEYPINHANEINLMLDNFVISKSICLIFSDQMEHLTIVNGLARRALLIVPLASG